MRRCAERLRVLRKQRRSVAAHTNASRHYRSHPSHLSAAAQSTAPSSAHRRPFIASVSHPPLIAGSSDHHHRAAASQPTVSRMTPRLLRSDMQPLLCPCSAMCCSPEQCIGVHWQRHTVCEVEAHVESCAPRSSPGSTASALTGSHSPVSSLSVFARSFASSFTASSRSAITRDLRRAHPLFIHRVQRRQLRRRSQVPIDAEGARSGDAAQ